MRLNEETMGFLAGVGAFTIWGSLVLFWRMLESVPASEILSYRIACSFLFLVPMLLYTGRWPEVKAAFADRHVRWRILCSTLLIGANWFTYIWAVNDGRILETSLGYYLTPLMNVALGYLLLRERSSRLQLLALLLAGGGVLWALILYGQFPWVGLFLSASFAAYGFIRKTVHVESLPGLFMETAMLLPVALGWIAWLAISEGQGFILNPSFRIGVPLVLTGLVTAVPLLMFAYAARHTSLSTIGFLQYLSPTGSFIIGVFVFHEPFSSSSFITFLCIWVALVLHSYDSWRHFRPRTVKK